jgi:hypothetical protein
MECTCIVAAISGVPPSLYVDGCSWLAAKSISIVACRWLDCFVSNVGAALALAMQSGTSLGRTEDPDSKVGRESWDGRRSLHPLHCRWVGVH